MLQLTKKEMQALLILFKEFADYYNAHTLSKVLGISHVGTQKMCKRLLEHGILKSKTIGKAITYKINLEDDYTCKLIAFLLADEANQYKRWIEEFKVLFKGERIILLYGSVIKNYTHAKDIDLMLVIKKEELKEIRKIIDEKQEILPKKIHAIELTETDLLENLKKKEEPLLDIIKNAVILYGQEKYVGVIKNVTSI